jgi:hypothetical protein
VSVVSVDCTSGTEVNWMSKSSDASCASSEPHCKDFVPILPGVPIP